MIDQVPVRPVDVYSFSWSALGLRVRSTFSMDIHRSQHDVRTASKCDQFFIFQARSVGWILLYFFWCVYQIKKTSRVLLQEKLTENKIHSSSLVVVESPWEQRKWSSVCCLALHFLDDNRGMLTDQTEIMTFCLAISCSLNEKLTSWSR